MRFSFNEGMDVHAARLKWQWRENLLSSANGSTSGGAEQDQCFGSEAAPAGTKD